MNDTTDISAAPVLLQKWLKIKAFINRAIMSPAWCAAEFTLACFIIFCDLEVPGAMVFAWIFIAKLILCNDVLAPFLTLLLMSVFLSDCYDSAQTFLPFMWMSIPLVAALLFHVLAYKPVFRPGVNLWGGVAVAVAVTLGGLGTISREEYFNGTSLYYVGFLGIGMLLAYIAGKSYIRVRREYDIFGRFAGMLYAMGLLCCFSIAVFYYRDWSAFTETHTMVNFQCSNNLATMLMIALPMPCLFASKGGRQRWHLVAVALMYVGLVLSGSRGGLLMGTVELFICIVYLCYADKKLWYVYGLVGVGAFMLLFFNLNNILAFYSIENLGGFISHDEARYGLLGRMKDDLYSNYLFGRGLGYRGNEDLYQPRAGAMNWYHMMIPQVVGSLGIVGVVAYCIQLGLRVYTVFRRPSTFKLAMGVSYAGLFLMSQVNPGEFCPVPYAIIAVLLFVMSELRDEAACGHAEKRSGEHSGPYHGGRAPREIRRIGSSFSGNHYNGSGDYSF